MSTIETIKQAIMADPQNKAYTDKGIKPHRHLLERRGPHRG